MFDGRIVNEDTFDRLRREDAQRLDDLIGSRIGITSAIGL
jgi:putative ABC transport system ATP-binding protein